MRRLLAELCGEEVDGGTAVAAFCRQLGITEATIYVCKKKYAGSGSTGIREHQSVA